MARMSLGRESICGGSAQLLRRLLPGRGIGHALGQQLPDAGHQLRLGREPPPPPVRQSGRRTRCRRPDGTPRRWRSAAPHRRRQTAPLRPWPTGWAAPAPDRRRSGRPSLHGRACAPRRRRPAGRSCRSWRIQGGASYCRRRPSSIRAWPRWKGLYSHMIPMAFTMFPLKMLQKVTIQLRDARICGNFSGFNGEINNLSGIYEILPESYHTSADFATEHLGVAFFPAV